MKPTVGRIVHYVPPWPALPGHNPEVLPAVIVIVEDDDNVTLGVFGRTYHTAKAVYLEPATAEHDSLPTPGTWFWPPRVSNF